MIKYLLVIITLLFQFNLLGQNRKFDSLWVVFKTKTQSDTNRLKAITGLATGILQNNPDSAIKLSDLELNLAKLTNQKKFEGKCFYIKGMAYSNKGDYKRSISNNLQAVSCYKLVNNKKGIAACYTNIGAAYWYQANYNKALEYYLNSIEVSKEVDDKMQIANCTRNIGAIYYNQTNYPKALQYYLTALKIYETNKDNFGISACYNNIGLVYINQLNYAKALEYYLKALKINQEIDYKGGLSNSYNNIAMVYRLQPTPNNEEALKYCFMSLKISQELNDKRGIRICYGNIGAIYSYQSKNAQALEWFFKDLEIAKEIEDKKGIISCYVNISDIHRTLGHFKDAIKYCENALKIAVEIGDLEIERKTYESLTALYADCKNYKEAYYNHLKFKKLTDSIFNVENSRELGDMKTNFEVDKKETELKLKAEAQQAINAEEKKRQKLISYSVGFVLLIVVLFSFFLYRRFKITQRQKSIIEEQKHVVEIQKKLVEEQKHIVEEKHKEITDSINYAERIQRSFIATKEILNENLNDYFVLFKPKDVVSGDFYWASKLNNGKFAFVTADSTGHGVPGAIMSLLNITSLEKAIETLTEPSEILNSTRKTIIERLKKDGSEHGGKDGMDASLCVYDFKNKKLIVAAANNPVWIVRAVSSSAVENKYEVLDIKPDKMPVGKHDRDTVSFTQQEIDLQNGDVVYTLTDGFPDQFGGEKGKKFMSKNLRELLAANSHLPMQEQKQLLEKTFAEWVGNLEQVDDVTLIGVRI